MSDTQSAPIAVGDRVRLATGATVTVDGVRRTSDNLSILTGGAWVDGVGAEVIEVA